MRSLFFAVGSVWLAAPIKGELFIVFISFPAFEISRPMPQHEAITVKTNGKMIQTDQLIIEDRNEERKERDDSADISTTITCLNQTHRKYIMISATARRECSTESCQAASFNGQYDWFISWRDDQHFNIGNFPPNYKDNCLDQNKTRFISSSKCAHISNDNARRWPGNQ